MILPPHKFADSFDFRNLVKYSAPDELKPSISVAQEGVTVLPR
jgi:hypothetical protein